MKLWFLADAASVNENWKWWLLAVFIMINLLVVISYPIIGWFLKQIWDRMKTGDDKSEAQGKELAVQTVSLNTLQKSVDDIKEALGAQEKVSRAMAIEGEGTFGEMRVHMERYFVRRDEFNALRTEMTNNISTLTQSMSRQHQTILEAILQSKGKQ